MSPLGISLAIKWVFTPPFSRGDSELGPVLIGMTAPIRNERPQRRMLPCKVGTAECYIKERPSPIWEQWKKESYNTKRTQFWKNSGWPEKRTGNRRIEGSKKKKNTLKGQRRKKIIVISFIEQSLKIRIWAREMEKGRYESSGCQKAIGYRCPTNQGGKSSWIHIRYAYICMWDTCVPK